MSFFTQKLLKESQFLSNGQYVSRPSQSMMHNLKPSYAGNASFNPAQRIPKPSSIQRLKFGAQNQMVHTKYTKPTWATSTSAKNPFASKVLSNKPEVYGHARRFKAEAESRELQRSIKRITNGLRVNKSLFLQACQETCQFLAKKFKEKSTKSKDRMNKIFDDHSTHDEAIESQMKDVGEEIKQYFGADDESEAEHQLWTVIQNLEEKIERNSDASMQETCRDFDIVLNKSLNEAGREQLKLVSEMMSSVSEMNRIVCSDLIRLETEISETRNMTVSLMTSFTAEITALEKFATEQQIHHESVKNQDGIVPEWSPVHRRLRNHCLRPLSRTLSIASDLQTVPDFPGLEPQQNKRTLREKNDITIRTPSGNREKRRLITIVDFSDEDLQFYD